MIHLSNITEEVIKDSTPLAWWQSFAGPIDQDPLDTAQQLHAATTSSAGEERMLSTIALVLTNVRNILGNEKAGKLRLFSNI